MSENEILQNAIQAAQAATSLFSVFLTIVSGYVVVLYLFLNRSGFFIRFIAFGLLSMSFAAVGLLAWNLQYLGEGMHEAWFRLPTKSTGMETLGPPIIVQNAFMQGGIVGMRLGWALGGLIYLALAYMTFVYRWPHRRGLLDGQG